MEINPLTVVQLNQAEAMFFLGAQDDPETVENVDIEVILTDGSRWSATLMTLAEIARIMMRWKATGENLSGTYFQCQDLIIVEQAGVTAAIDLLNGLVDSGEFRSAMVRIDIED